MIDINWIYLVAALVLGFLFKVLFDELKSPRLRIVGVSRQPFTISPEIKVIGEGFDNYYTAYRIRVENKQKRYLNCAAENCIAWLELDSAPEPYQICWVGNCSDVTINVGDVREVDFCARGNTTGRIYAPTERGYFDLSPRQIGDGKSELQGKLKVTSKNGRREEKRFIIKPNNNQLEITILDKEGNKVSSNSSKLESKTQVNKNHSNVRSELRLFVELFSLTTIFFLFSIISFSMKEADREIFSLNITIPYEGFFALGCIYVALSLFSLFLLYSTQRAKRLEEWLEHSSSRLNKVIWAVFWPLLWMAFSITFISGLVDGSNKLQAPWNGMAFFSGSGVYLLASIKIIISGAKRTWKFRK